MESSISLTLTVIKMRFSYNVCLETQTPLYLFAVQHIYNMRCQILHVDI